MTDLLYLILGALAFAASFGLLAALDRLMKG
jgi:hypothetical protein